MRGESGFPEFPGALVLAVGLMSNGLIQAAFVNAWLEDYQGLDGVWPANEPAGKPAN